MKALGVNSSVNGSAVAMDSGSTRRLVVGYYKDKESDPSVNWDRSNGALTVW